jgi:hypothetical protein
MSDFQFGWYMKLLIESADSPIPGYLPGSLDKLWQIAGAKSQSYFEKWGGCELVSRLFRCTEISGQTWIYNERMLQVIYEQNSKLSHRQRKRSVSLSLSLCSFPSFIPEEEFRQYLDMRKAIGKEMTPHAIKLAYGKLEKLKAEGHEPKAVLEQSIFNSWQGLFPVHKDTQVETNGRGTTKAERRNRDISEATARVFGIHREEPGHVPKSLPDKTAG